MSRAAVTMPRGAISRFLAPKPTASTSDGEEEWAPRHSGRRLVDEDEDDEEEEGKTDSARRYADGDDSDRGSMSDFIVDDEAGSDENEEDEDDDIEEISEAEEDNDFEERPLNRPVRASTTSSKSSGAKQPRKKRKRSTTEGEERRNRTRRRELAAIRDDDDLDDPTRLAREAEKLRASGMQFGQDEVIDAEDNAAALDALSAEDQVPLVCLNPRKEDGQPPDGPLGSETQPVFVHPAVSGKLKKHQVKGAQFLWSHVAPEPSGFGCILADFMGLGKTLQVITVVQAFLALKRRRSSDGSLVNRHKHVLILAPTICVRNWEAEIVKWIGKKDARKLGVHTLESSREKKMVDRVTIVKQWHRRGGILIMGYELYRILVLQSSGEEKIAAGNAKHTHLIREVYKCISDPGPDLIVLDEGHRVRDHKSKLVKALSHVKTARRIILTGYPLQNHLEEYWTMVNFARPDYLGSLEDFKNRFVNPIENGQCVDSTESDRKLARQRAFILTHELKTLVLRRDQEFLFRQLPPKKEWVMLCKLTEPQATLYRKFLEFGVPKRVGGKIDVLGGYHISLAISNHPDVLEETYRYLEEAVRKGTLVSGVRKRTGRSNNDDGGEDEDLLQYLTVDLGQPSGGSAAATASRRESTGLSDEDSDSILEALDAPSAGRGGANRAPPTGVEHRLSFAQEFMQQYLSGMLESSGKMQLLMEILRECKAIGDRVILFSQSIPTLNTVEKMIAQSNRREKRHSNRMTYLRIDGSTPQQERFRMIGQFNDLEEDADLIMISTKAGGEGVNLCAGNRIIIFDVCWNPCNDSQSMCRSYRFGQVKPVFVYRFVSAGTMEKKVYDLQIRKEGVAKRIVDEKALERKFKTADLQNYFNLDDFEQAMQQQSTVLSRPPPAAPANTTSSPTIVSIEDLSSDTSSAATESTVEAALSATSISSTAPGGDAVLEKVLNKIQDERLDWVIDWFEQETMFEETIDDNCTEAEQEEITSSYKYMKAVRGMRLDGSKDGVLVMVCGTCRIPNNIYPESMTRVPVPKYIECQYCKRPTATTGAIPHAQAQANPAALAAVASAGGTPLVGYPGARGAYLPYGIQAGVAGRIDTGAAASGAPVGAQFAVENMAPHIRALHIQQQLQQQQAALSSSEALRRQLEQDRREREMKLKERETWKLCDRTLLVLRRGINKVQELKRMAESCGARLAIEVNPQLTDIVSGLSVKETLEWLKLNKLPRDVSFHNEAWLRDEIAKEKGLPRLTAGESKPAAPTGSSAGDVTSSTAGSSRQQAIAIDLSDSDGDADMDGGNSVTIAAATRATAALPATQQQDELDDDDDFVEIID